MHPSIYEIGRQFFEIYVSPNLTRVLEIGSQDVNGSLRDFKPTWASWVGIDLSPGKGVDLVLDDPYVYPFEDGSFDVIVSSSCYEHDPMFWLTFSESCRVLSESGVMYITAPTAGIYHGWPKDYWRLWTDAGGALEAWGRRQGHSVKLVESFVDCHGATSAAYWNDLVLIFSKAEKLEAAPRLSKVTATAADVRVGSAGDRIRPIL